MSIMKLHFFWDWGSSFSAQSLKLSTLFFKYPLNLPYFESKIILSGYYALNKRSFVLGHPMKSLSASRGLAPWPEIATLEVYFGHSYFCLLNLLG